MFEELSAEMVKAGGNLAIYLVFFLPFLSSSTHIFRTLLKIGLHMSCIGDFLVESLGKQNCSTHRMAAYIARIPWRIFPFKAS